jgi:hypothetical protein
MARQWWAVQGKPQGFAGPFPVRQPCTVCHPQLALRAAGFQDLSKGAIMADTIAPRGESQEPLPFVPPLVPPLRVPQRPALLAEVERAISSLCEAVLHAVAVVACLPDAVDNIEGRTESGQSRADRSAHAVDLAYAAHAMAERALEHADKLELKATAASLRASDLVDEAATAMRDMLRETEVLGCSPMAAGKLRTWLATYAPEPRIAAPGARRGAKKGARNG